MCYVDVIISGFHGPSATEGAKTTLWVSNSQDTDGVKAMIERCFRIKYPIDYADAQGENVWFDYNIEGGPCNGDPLHGPDTVKEGEVMYEVEAKANVKVRKVMQAPPDPVEEQLAPAAQGTPGTPGTPVPMGAPGSSFPWGA